MCLSVDPCVPLQIPLASDNTQFESHRVYMPPPSRDFSVPSRLQDSHYTNVVGHGIVDNYSQPLDVSNVIALIAGFF